MVGTAAAPAAPACQQEWGHDAGVGATALWIAHVRTCEAQQESPLFVDPYAARFSGESGAEVEKAIVGPLGNWYYAGANGKRISTRLIPYFASPGLAHVRRKVLDTLKRAPDENHTQRSIEYLRHAIRNRTAYFDEKMVASSGITQFVTMGSGCDCRCLRLSDKLCEGAQHWLIDQPAVTERFADVLKDELSCASNVHLVGVRFGEEKWTDRLMKSGFDPTKKTFWLVEGLVMYLQESDIKELFAGIVELSSSGSVVAGDYPGQGMLDHPAFADMMKALEDHNCKWTWAARNSVAFASLMNTLNISVVEDTVAGSGLKPHLLELVDKHFPHVPEYRVYVANIAK